MPGTKEHLAALLAIPVGSSVHIEAYAGHFETIYRHAADVFCRGKKREVRARIWRTAEQMAEWLAGREKADAVRQKYKGR